MPGFAQRTNLWGEFGHGRDGTCPGHCDSVRYISRLRQKCSSTCVTAFAFETLVCSIAITRSGGRDLSLVWSLPLPLLCSLFTPHDTSHIDRYNTRQKHTHQTSHSRAMTMTKALKGSRRPASTTPRARASTQLSHVAGRDHTSTVRGSTPNVDIILWT